jgi:hypothetical protein
MKTRLYCWRRCMTAAVSLGRYRRVEVALGGSDAALHGGGEATKWRRRCMAEFLSLSVPIHESPIDEVPIQIESIILNLSNPDRPTCAHS